MQQYQTAGKDGNSEAQLASLTLVGVYRVCNHHQQPQKKEKMFLSGNYANVFSNETSKSNLTL